MTCQRTSPRGRFPWFAAVVFALIIFFAPQNAPAQDESKGAPPVSDEIKSALDNLEDRITSDPGDAQAIFQKATLLSKIGRADEAQQLFEELIDRFPSLPEPYNNLAALYAGQGKLLEARNVLETLAASFPDMAIAHQNLADVYAAMAASEYQKVIKLGVNEEETRKKMELLQKIVDYLPPGEDGTAAAVKAGEEAEAVQERIPVQYEQMDTSGMEQFDMTPSAEDIEMVITNWAKAWSKRDADLFLSFYGPDYSAVEGMTPEDWRESIKKEIKARQWIKVGVRDVEVDMISARKATAKFTQSYSSNLEEKGGEQTRIAVFEMLQGRWRIVDEEKL